MQNGDGPSERLRRQQGALADFGLHAFRSTDLDEILQRATELVAEGLDVKRAKVLELQREGTELLIRAGVNWNPGVVGHVRFGADGDSPAGYALRHDEPIVSPDLARETRFRIPQVLIDHGIRSMVNVIIEGQNGPFGVLEVDASRERRFTGDDISFLRTYANLLAAAIDRHRAYRELERSANEQKILVQELSHRVRNLLGLVQSLARQSTAEKPGAREFQEDFIDRLQALARAENLIVESQAREIDLLEIVRRSVEPFERDDGHGGVSIDGDPVRLPARSGRFISLVMHELGTNSTKYGALSVPEGEVRVSWSVEEPAEGKLVRLRWTEAGGPPVDAPDRQGFGTKLIDQLAAHELDGTSELNFAREGFEYGIAFPVRSQ